MRRWRARPVIYVPAVMLMGLVVFYRLAGIGGPGQAPVALALVETTTLSVLSGSVEVRPAAAPAWLPAVSGQTLAAGDSVKTAANSYALITYFEGSTTSIDAETEFQITKLDKDAAGITTEVGGRLVAGSTFSKVLRLLDPSSRFAIETPSAVAVVRGTEFRISISPLGETEIVATTGEVVAEAAGVAVAVAAGQVTSVQPGRPPDPPRPAPPAPTGLRLTLASPASLYVCDNAGRCTGLMRVPGLAQGIPVNQIPSAYYSGPGYEPQIMVFPRPLGRYTVVFDALGDGGTYHFEVAGLGDNEVHSLEAYAGRIARGTRQQTGFPVNIDGAGRVEVGTISEPALTQGPPPGALVAGRVVLTPLPEGTAGPTVQALLAQRTVQARQTITALGGTPTHPIGNLPTPDVAALRRLSPDQARLTPRPAAPPAPPVPTIPPALARALTEPRSAGQPAAVQTAISQAQATAIRQATLMPPVASPMTSPAASPAAMTATPPVAPAAGSPTATIASTPSPSPVLTGTPLLAVTEVPAATLPPAATPVAAETAPTAAPLPARTPPPLDTPASAETPVPALTPPASLDAPRAMETAPATGTPPPAGTLAPAASPPPAGTPRPPDTPVPTSTAQATQAAHPTGTPRPTDTPGPPAQTAGTATPAGVTGAGSNVVVTGPSGETVTFARVTAPGFTVITYSTTAPLPQAPPAASVIGRYVTVTTTARYSGSVTICLPPPLSAAYPAGTGPDDLFIIHGQIQRGWAAPAGQFRPGGQVCAPVAAFSTFALAVPQPPVSPGQPPGSIIMYAAPAEVRASPGGVFPLTVRLDTGSQPVDSAEFELWYNPGYFEVVDAAGAPVTLGPAQPGAALPVVLLNAVDPGSGVVRFAAGKAVSATGPGVDASGHFVLATIHVRLKPEAPLPAAGETISFEPAGTSAFYQGQNVFSPRGAAWPARISPAAE